MDWPASPEGNRTLDTLVKTQKNDKETFCLYVGADINSLIPAETLRPVY